MSIAGYRLDIREVQAGTGRIMKYRKCPNSKCNATVEPVRIDTFSKYYVDHLVQCPKCGWYGCQSEEIEDAEPVQLIMVLSAEDAVS